MGLRDSPEDPDRTHGGSSSQRLHSASRPAWHDGQNPRSLQRDATGTPPGTQRSARARTRAPVVRSRGSARPPRPPRNAAGRASACGVPRVRAPASRSDRRAAGTATRPTVGAARGLGRARRRTRCRAWRHREARRAPCPAPTLPVTQRVAARRSPVARRPRQRHGVPGGDVALPNDRGRRARLSLATPSPPPPHPQARSRGCPRPRRTCHPPYQRSSLPPAWRTFIVPLASVVTIAAWCASTPKQPSLPGASTYSTSPSGPGYVSAQEPRKPGPAPDAGPAALTRTIAGLDVPRTAGRYRYRDLTAPQVVLRTGSAACRQLVWLSDGYCQLIRCRVACWLPKTVTTGSGSGW